VPDLLGYIDARMIELTADESRALGVLIEKAFTTPDQYPLSLNAVVNGANQKNNRDPVTAMAEDAAFEALEGLRGKGLVVRVDTLGARVHKFRHNTGEVLHARAGEVAVLAELLLRGPQTLGELRGRASRMAPMENLETARDYVRALLARPEPLVKELPPVPGTRAERYAQLLCADLHPLDHVAAASPPSQPASPDRLARIEAEIESLKTQIETLQARLDAQHPST
jgi:uncharacterized protein YceH (UPF0502 family)